MAAIKRRGGWKTDRRLQRYEKHALLSKTWGQLPLQFRSHAKQREERLGDISLAGQALLVFPSS